MAKTVFLLGAGFNCSILDEAGVFSLELLLDATWLVAGIEDLAARILRRVEFPASLAHQLTSPGAPPLVFIQPATHGVGEAFLSGHGARDDFVPELGRDFSSFGIVNALFARSVERPERPVKILGASARIAVRSSVWASGGSGARRSAGSMRSNTCSRLDIDQMGTT